MSSLLSLPALKRLVMKFHYKCLGPNHYEIVLTCRMLSMSEVQSVGTRSCFSPGFKFIFSTHAKTGGTALRQDLNTTKIPYLNMV